MSARYLVVLDSLYDTLDIETSTAVAHGWELSRWDGSAEQLGRADVVVHVRTRIDHALIAQLTRCRVIGRFGVGLDSVDQAAAAEHQIAVVNVRDYCIPEMTAHTLALGFGLERRLGGWNNRDWLDADWQAVAKTRPVRGRTRVTVIGLGSIGSAVASALRDLAYDVVVVTTRGQATANQLRLRVLPLEDALQRADFVFLHAALEPATANLLDQRRLALMPADAILVNTARLGLIDQTAIAVALTSGRLGGLGLDARLEPQSPLRRFASDPRVLITPHVGWYSERSQRVLRQSAIKNSIDAYGTVAGRKAS
ncbi:MAG: NAD(P)-binding domain-containing protein [Candidatus Dormibacteraeota bacterium]|nr:NAD(P)-binding domain-containing protein [Candidatus Dormibacteraeota bacterium]